LINPSVRIPREVNFSTLDLAVSHIDREPVQDASFLKVF